MTRLSLRKERAEASHSLALFFVLKGRAGTMHAYKAGEPEETGFDSTRGTILLGDTGPGPLDISAQ